MCVLSLILSLSWHQLPQPQHRSHGWLQAQHPLGKDRVNPRLVYGTNPPNTSHYNPTDHPIPKQPLQNAIWLWLRHKDHNKHSDSDASGSG